MCYVIFLFIVMQGCTSTKIIWDRIFSNYFFPFDKSSYGADTLYIFLKLQLQN
jgi:hypothetical protein